MNAFVHDKRKGLSARERAAFFRAAGGKCERCTRPIGVGEDWDVVSGEIDHVHALGAGGSDEQDNLQLLCQHCHSHKTTDDRAIIAKAQRVAIKHLVPRRRRVRMWK